jgi:hypothetical protein
MSLLDVLIAIAPAATILGLLLVLEHRIHPTNESGLASPDNTDDNAWRE